MATIPPTTSTSTATTAASAASVTKSAAQSILTSLNTGSGVDTDSLVSGLVQAQFAAKTAALTARTTALTAQISAAGSLKNTIANFSKALGTLTSGGTLQTQPVSSNSNVLSASAIAGSQVGSLNASITVNALATAQGTRSTVAVADRTATIATGTLTLTLGTATYNAGGTAMESFTAGTAAAVSINVTDGSLDGIAAAINAANAGVTANVITDQDGQAVLSLKGTTGAAQAFTLKADDGASALAQFDIGVGVGVLTGTAANANLTVDGVTVQRSSNTVTDLLPGVNLQLKAVSTTPVSLSTTRPTDALTQAISDFVETYNGVYAEAKSMTDAINGDLKMDPAAKTLLRSLQGLTTKTMVSGAASGAPSTLAQLGIATNRDGTLTIDTNTLNTVLAAYPAEVEAMFATTSGNAVGLNSALASISLAASSSVFGLGASTERYTKTKTDIATQQADISVQSESMTTRLTQQFATMNSRVTAYKATQTFLENQIKAWNKDS